MKIKGIKAIEIFPKQCSNTPCLERTFYALWSCVFSFSRLKKDSMVCLTVDTAAAGKPVNGNHLRIRKLKRVVVAKALGNVLQFVLV
jgi:hypothetical protein